MPNDLRICVGYVYRNEGYDDVIKYTRITGAHALAIAQTIDEPFEGSFKAQRAVQVVLSDLDRSREQRRRTAQERIAAAQAELAALDAEVAGK